MSEPKKWRITWRHTVEIEYESIIEANTEEEARKIFEDDPFYVDPEECGQQGFDIEIDDVEEVDEETEDQ